VPERVYGVVDLAPGGRRLAVHVADVNDYIWIYEFDRQEGRKLGGSENSGWPVWTPDGQSVTFSSGSPSEGWKVESRIADGAPEAELLFDETTWPVTNKVWTVDGRTLAYNGRGDRFDIRVFTVAEKKPVLWLPSAGSERLGVAFSPDNRWLVHASDETGRFEIWIRSFPDGQVVRQVSVDGGVEPLWCEACDEIFYRKGNQWLASRSSLAPKLSWEPPVVAFETDFIDTSGRSYDVSPDGRRLLVVKSVREATRTKVHIVHNWINELKERVPINK
jgi:Tol biopolymer transport system component